MEKKGLKTVKESEEAFHACPSCSKPVKKWYKERIFLTVVTAVAVLAAAYMSDFSRPFTLAFFDYLGMIWWALLIGFLLGGLMEYYIPKEYIQKYFSVHKKRTIFYSVGLGFMMSACSHGILAISMELYKKGASTASVIAFLLASPWANLPVTILLFSFFGLNAFYIIISAIIIAITTGLIYQVLDKRCIVECRSHNLKVDEKFSVRKDMSRRLNNYRFTSGSIAADTKGVLKGSWALTKMIMWWIVIGMLMASFANAFVPHEIFMMYLGPTMLGMVLTLIIAAVIEVCSEGSSPLAFEIYKQTGAFGNSFVFLNGGVATDYTEIGLIWSNIGKRTALLLPLITVPQILVLGYVFNVFL
jgi:uncharacterized membrane protein YraQ (UPF0718 family)